MMHAAVRRFDDVAPVWEQVTSHLPVKLSAIQSARHYKAMIRFMNELLEEVGDRGSHPLSGLLDVVTMFVRDYEDRHQPVPKAAPEGVLRFLMDQHDLRQTDLADLFGSQSNVVFI